MKLRSKTDEIFQKMINLSNFSQNSTTIDYLAFRSRVNLLDYITMLKESINKIETLALILEIIDETIFKIITPGRDKDKIAEKAFKIVCRVLEIATFYTEAPVSPESKMLLTKKGFAQIDLLERYLLEEKSSHNSSLALEIGFLMLNIQNYPREILIEKVRKIANNSFNLTSSSNFHTSPPISVIEQILNNSNSSNFVIRALEWGTDPTETFTDNSKILASSSVNLTIRDFENEPVYFEGNYRIALKKKSNHMHNASKDEVICNVEYRKSGNIFKEFGRFILETEGEFICEYKYLGLLSVEVRLFSEIKGEEVREYL